MDTAPYSLVAAATPIEPVKRPSAGYLFPIVISGVITLAVFFLNGESKQQPASKSDADREIMIQQVAIGDRGRVLVVRSRAEGVFIHSADTLEMIGKVEMPAREVRRMSVAANGNLVAVGGPRKVVLCRITPEGIDQREIAVERGVVSLALSPNGKHLAIASVNPDVFVRVIETSSGRACWEFRRATAPNRSPCLTFDTTGKQFAFDLGERIYFARLDRQQPVHVSSLQNKSVCHLATSGRGSYVGVNSYGLIRRWSLTGTGLKVDERQTDLEVHRVCRCGSRLYLGGVFNTVQSGTVTTGFREGFATDERAPVNSMAASPDECLWVSTGCADLAVWNTDLGGLSFAARYRWDATSGKAVFDQITEREYLGE